MVVHLVAICVFTVYSKSTLESMGVRGIDGKLADLYGFGMLLILTTVILYHVYVSLCVGGWNRIYTPIFILSLLMMPLDFYGG